MLKYTGEHLYGLFWGIIIGVVRIISNGIFLIIKQGIINELNLYHFQCKHSIFSVRNDIILHITFEKARVWNLFFASSL